MQKISNFSTWFSKLKLAGKLGIGCLSLIILCCLCSVPIALLNPAETTPEVKQPSVSNVASTPVSVATDKPADAATSAPTVAPLPTETPAPTDTPSPSNTPTLPPAGDSRSNPSKAGVPVDTGDNMTVTILGATRPADTIVSSGNMFNTSPEAGKEYLMVEIQIVCNRPGDQKCYFGSTEIKAVGTDGNILDSEFLLAGVDGLLESGEFFGGGIRKGRIFFIVNKDDKNIVLFTDPLLFGNSTYFALP